MANIMQMANVKNNVHRSGFDLSERRLFTSKTAEILPCGVFGVLPGDKFQINLSHFMRTVPVQTASFGRLRHYVDAYFVPLRLLWDKFPSWVVQTKNQFYAKSLTDPVAQFTSQPYFLPSDIAQYLNDIQADVDDGGLEPAVTTIKLLENLGYGDFGGSDYHPSNSPLNPFPLLAYQKIYQDYFRFSQWEDAAPWTYNLDFVMQNSDLHLNIASLAHMSSTNLLGMRYCNYDKDLFHGFMPTSQYGDDAIASPIIGNIHGDLQVNIPSSTSVEGNSLTPIFRGDNTKPNGSIVLTNTTSLSHQMHNTSLFSIDQTDSTTAGLSILLIRQAEALQKWKEITLSGSQDYREQLYKHWNVRVPETESDMCKYLGGIAENVDVSEVVNQNLEAPDSRADIAGMGKQASAGRIDFYNSTQDFGILMLVSHVKPIAEWDNARVVNPLFFLHEATDYPIPEFDNLGMEAIPSTLFHARDHADNQVFPVGYAPRYYGWKTNYDKVCGEFRKTYRPWVLPVPTIGSWVDKKDKITYSYFKVNPKITDEMFLLPATASTESDLYKHSLYCDVKVTRNLSYDGMPY